MRGRVLLACHHNGFHETCIHNAEPFWAGRGQGEREGQGPRRGGQGRRRAVAGPREAGLYDVRCGLLPLLPPPALPPPQPASLPGRRPLNPSSSLGRTREAARLGEGLEGCAPSSPRWTCPACRQPRHTSAWIPKPGRPPHL